MTKRTGPVETELQRQVLAYLTRHGHGSATKLAKRIGRSSAWVGLYSEGKRFAGIDDAIQIARALGLDLAALCEERKHPDTSALELRPLDRREQTLQQLFVRLRTEQAKTLLVRMARDIVALDTKPRR